MSNDFNEILERQADEIEEPRNPPEGTWELQVVSGKCKKGRGENGPDLEALYALRALEAGDDVSDAELEMAGAIEDLNPVYYRIPVFDRRGEWNIKRFAQTLGVDTAGLNLKQMVEETKGMTFKGHLVEVTLEGREDPVINIEQIARV